MQASTAESFRANVSGVSTLEAGYPAVTRSAWVSAFRVGERAVAARIPLHTLTRGHPLPGC